MDSFKLVVPTHGRYARQITLQSLPPSIRKKVLVVTSLPDEAKYIAAHHGVECVVAKGVRSIAEKRHWIMKNVSARYPFMMDDDLTFFKRCLPQWREYTDGQWRLAKFGQSTANTYLLNKATEVDLINAFKGIELAFAQGFAAVGMSSRMGNQRTEPDWEINTRLMHAFGVDAQVYKKLKLNFAEVQCREDFNIALRLLRAGHQNTCLYDTCCSPGSYNAPGGASTERTLAQSDAEAERLAKLHPGLVRVVQRGYGTSVPRKEVVISWKKAYAQGGAR